MDLMQSEPIVIVISVISADVGFAGYYGVGFAGYYGLRGGPTAARFGCSPEPDRPDICDAGEGEHLPEVYARIHWASEIPPTACPEVV